MQAKNARSNTTLTNSRAHKYIIVRHSAHISYSYYYLHLLIGHRKDTEERSTYLAKIKMIDARIAMFAVCAAFVVNVLFLIHYLIF